MVTVKCRFSPHIYFVPCWKFRYACCRFYYRSLLEAGAPKVQSVENLVRGQRYLRAHIVAHYGRSICPVRYLDEWDAMNSEALRQTGDTIN